MGRRLARIVDPGAPGAIVLVRGLVGLVFFSEGVQKLLFPAALGVGRFAKIGIPAPEVLAPLVGVVEIACGALVLVGLLTRLAAVPLIATITVAISTTKVPLLLHRGVWAAAHEARTDVCMLLGSICLVLVGAGPLSLDAWLSRRLAR